MTTFVTFLLILRAHNNNLYFKNVKTFISCEIIRSDLELKTSNTNRLLAVQAFTRPHLKYAYLNIS